jgi:hypothetical protein
VVHDVVTAASLRLSSGSDGLLIAQGTLHYPGATHDPMVS